MTKLVLIDVYNDGGDLLLVDDHDGKLNHSLKEWRKLDERYALGVSMGGEDCDWVGISEWLSTHGYSPIPFEKVTL